MAFSFRDWYEVHGQRLNEKRRSRYQTDPEYRERVLRTNQESRKNRKKPDSEASASKRVARPRAEERRWKTVEPGTGGTPEKLFSIGAVAEALGCSIQAIRLWERQGHIPPTPIRSGKDNTGDRLYTQAMVDEIRGILIEQGRIGSEGRKVQASRLRPLKRYVRSVDGTVREVNLYLIGALADAVGRNVVTLEQLEARGYLPKTPFRASSVGRRLYSEPMIAAVKVAFEERGGDIRGEESWKSFHDQVLSSWTNLGVIGSVLVQSLNNEASGPVNESQD